MIFVVSSEYIPDVEVEAETFIMDGRNVSFYAKKDTYDAPNPVAFIASTYRIRVKEVANG